MGNRDFLNAIANWPEAGEEWSKRWGSAHMQWYGSILPRISAFLPVDTILEVAPGYGRWTAFLKDLCKQLIIVDLAESCIDRCRRRFADCSHISYFVNDGRSLEMIVDGSIDFIFSFDSLVHAEEDVLEAYTELRQNFDRALPSRSALRSSRGGRNGLDQEGNRLSRRYSEYRRTDPRILPPDLCNTSQAPFAVATRRARRTRFLS